MCMKILRSCILAVAVFSAAAGLLGCQQSGGTLSSIAVTPVVQSMAPGTTVQFIATATFSDGALFFWTPVVTWSSSDTTVATISNDLGTNGLVTSVANGTTTITAYDKANNVTGTALLTVTDPLALAVSPADSSMAIGTSFQFVATLAFPDNTVQSIATTQAFTSVSWDSSNPAVAMITDTGLVTAGVDTTTAIGTTTITAFYTGSSNTTVSGSTPLKVTAIPLASIFVNPSTITLAAGANRQFTAMGIYADGSTRPMTFAVVWSSSDVTIATISNTEGSQGVVTAIAAGVVTITATDPVTKIAVNSTLTVTAE
jgi:uncharacterized protein YjdB